MVNHYLRRHGTDSMPKKRRLRRWLLTLFVLFCSMSPWQGVQAYTDWNADWSQIWFEPSTGCINYNLRIYQSFGGAATNCGSSGFSDDFNKNERMSPKTHPKHVISISHVKRLVIIIVRYIMVCLITISPPLIQIVVEMTRKVMFSFRFPFLSRI